MTEILVALIGLAGSGLGSVLGILVSSKLTQYRLEQLEKRTELQEEKIKVANHRIGDLEKKVDG